MHTLVDRFSIEEYQLRRELSGLLLRELENTLTLQEQEQLNEVNSLFLWDVQFSVECSYRPVCTSTDGTYYPNSLEEFRELQVGKTASELSVDDLEECSLDEFDSGEVFVEGKKL